MKCLLSLKEKKNGDNSIYYACCDEKMNTYEVLT